MKRPCDHDPFFAIKWPRWGWFGFRDWAGSVKGLWCVMLTVLRG
jgi:hypothetical protein